MTTSTSTSHTASLSSFAHILVVQDKAEATIAIQVREESLAKAQKTLRDSLEKLQKSAKKFSLSAQANNRTFQDEMEPRGKNNDYFKTGKTIGFCQAIVIAYDFEKLNAFVDEIVDKKIGTATASHSSISSKARLSAEARLTEEALESFSARAKLVAKALGHKKFSFAEVDVSAVSGENEQRYHQPRMVAMSASIGSASGGSGVYDSTSGYISAREERLSVTVNGSIHLE